MRTQGACGRKGPCDRSLVEAPPCCTAARPCFQPRAIVATQGPAPGVHHVACGRVVSCRVLFCCTTPHGFAFHSAIPKRGARASYSQNAGAEAWPDAHAASFSAPTLSALLFLESAARGIQDRPPTRCRPTRQGKRGRGNVRGSGRAGVGGGREWERESVDVLSLLSSRLPLRLPPPPPYTLRGAYAREGAELSAPASSESRQEIEKNSKSGRTRRPGPNNCRLGSSRSSRDGMSPGPRERERESESE